MGSQRLSTQPASHHPRSLLVFSGQIGVITTSSKRFKDDIVDMGDVSDALMNVRPVTFRYKQPASDGSKPLQYGLVAEELAEKYPDLVVKDKDGQSLAIREQELSPMLLNEAQKQHRLVMAQGEQITEQHNLIEHLQERLNALEGMVGSAAK